MTFSTTGILFSSVVFTVIIDAGPCWIVPLTMVDTNLCQSGVFLLRLLLYMHYVPDITFLDCNNPQHISQSLAFSVCVVDLEMSSPFCYFLVFDVQYSSLLYVSCSRNLKAPLIFIQ